MTDQESRLGKLFTYLESFVTIERGGLTTRVFRLERMKDLLDRTGHPELGRPAIHLAGSKGKGSTAIMVASLLDELGYRAGVYLSPHVEDYRERFFVVNDQIPAERYVAVLEDIERLVEEEIRPLRPEAELPTAFELLTLVGFLLFERERCDWQVIETGLGGRLDATNVVTPSVTIITPIELEHTEYLGETIREIAGEKAGIIKPGAPVITGRQRPEALKVIAERARSVGVPLLVADPERMVGESPSGGYTITLPNGELTLDAGMAGRHQAENALLALTAVLSQYPDADFDALRRGIEKARLPGRFEVACEKPPIVIDGAHTPDSLRLFLEEVRRRYPTMDTMVFGPVAGKRYAEMAPLVAAFARNVILCDGHPQRRVDMPALVAALEEAGSLHIFQAPSVAEALSQATDAAGEKGFVVTGSFYLVGAARRRLLSGPDLPSTES
ncbi:MAG: bifunctional folylpolyglutamate synthase/dihydrofolate synthase [Spirochaetaceae bacterium]